MGKSALVCNIAENAAVGHKRPVALFSLEMAEAELAQRFVATYGPNGLNCVGLLNKPDPIAVTTDGNGVAISATFNAGNTNNNANGNGNGNNNGNANGTNNTPNNNPNVTPTVPATDPNATPTTTPTVPTGSPTVTPTTNPGATPIPASSPTATPTTTANN